MKKFLFIVFFLLIAMGGYAQVIGENAELTRASQAAAEGSYQVWVRNSPNKEIVPIPEEVLSQIDAIRHYEEERIIQLSADVTIVVFPFAMILDSEFIAPEIYVFID